MITSLSKHAPERHTEPSHGHGIASLCLATQQAVSRSLMTSYGLSGQNGSAPVPGQTAIAGRKAIVRLIEGVLRSLPHHVFSGTRTDHHADRAVVAVLIKAAQKLRLHADALENANLAVFSAGNNKRATSGFNFVIGIVCKNFHDLISLCFLTYGNECAKSRTMLPKDRKYSPSLTEQVG